MSAPQAVNDAAPRDKPQEPQRLVTVAARVTRKEKHAIRVAAAREDKTPSEYIRDLVLTALSAAA